ncbi:MAG: type III pantothenate kinase [Oscillospiraceae bacterium]|nr:type III pantothenate kinase [Oscillospiraceae bacterium]
MILAVDVGNTNIVIGCLEQGEIKNTVRVRTEPGRTAAEYGIELMQLFDFFGIERRGFEGAILSSVVPPVNEPLRQAIEMLTGVKCLIVGPGMKTGMNVRIDDPGTLGCDLVVGGVAAIAEYGAPVIVLDLGTATTITLIDENKCFRGGAILPGIKLSYAALAAGTSLLPDISITPPKKCIATNTVDCMRSGAVFGTAATIDGMVDRMEAELGLPCKVVATGGLASKITPYCRREVVCDDHLLLKGLWVLYQKNN